VAYFLDLFSPETYDAFRRSARDVSGFRPRQRLAAGRVSPGDRFICYMTKLGRWFGVLEVASGPYQDRTPIFYKEDDPFVVRFKIRPIVILDVDKAIPIREDEIWNALSFTKEYDKRSKVWTGKIRSSLVPLSTEDGEFLEHKLFAQADGGKVYPVEEGAFERYRAHTVRRADKVVNVYVPEDVPTEEADEHEPQVEARESIRIQALIAEIGSRMGMHIWIPRNDRSGVLKEWRENHAVLLERLPLNYDDTTPKTIEQIDVLWLRGRSIVRAFEVEHTTAIYSGILRMADLLALQPNMDIKLHIVAPSSKRDKVMREIQRPVFSLLEHGPLAESCTYLRYESLREIAAEKHLSHLSDSVLDDYAEEATEEAE
jgi:predicted RNA-binding protein